MLSFVSGRLYTGPHPGDYAIGKRFIRREFTPEELRQELAEAGLESLETPEDDYVSIMARKQAGLS